ncbi:MAG: MFS transporter [Acidobacteriota bacterium]|nr:MFS transporter [Acidobacteriota bacterium]
MPTADLRRVCALNFTRSLAYTSILFLLPLQFVRIGFNGWQIGLIVSLLSIAPLLAAFPTGWVNDRFSIAGAIRAAFLADAFLLAILAVTTSFPAVCAAFFLLGAANNILDVSLASLVYKDQTAMDQNRKYGLYVFWNGFGAVFGVAGGGLLVQASDFRIMLFLFGGVMLLAAAFVRPFEAGKFHLTGLRDYGRSVLRRKSLLFVVFVFFLGLHWAVEGTVYAPFLEKRFGLDTWASALYMAAGLLFLPIGALAIGRRKFGLAANRKLILAAMALSGGGLILMTFGGVYISLAFRLIHDFGDGAAGVLIALYTSRLFEKQSIGGSAALVLAVQILAKMLGAMILTPLGFRYGLQWPFWVAGGLLLADAVYGAVIFKRIEY